MPYVVSHFRDSSNVFTSEIPSNTIYNLSLPFLTPSHLFYTSKHHHLQGVSGDGEGWGFKLLWFRDKPRPLLLYLSSYASDTLVSFFFFDWINYIFACTDNCCCCQGLWIAVSGSYSVTAGPSLWRRLLFQSTGSWSTGLICSTWAQELWLMCSSVWTQSLWPMVLIAPQYVGSS